MTERELEMAISDYCSVVGEWNKDELGDKLMPYSGSLDYSHKTTELVRRCYQEYIKFYKAIPSYSDLSQCIFDDYSNRQYAIASLEIADYHDYSLMTRSEFDEFVEELAFSNIDCDSYGGYLNYDEMLSHSYELEDGNGILLLTNEGTYNIEDFIGYTKYMKEPDRVRDRIEWLYENDVVSDIVVGDSQQLLIPDFVVDNSFRNSYGELCIVTDNKLERLRSA